MKCVLISGASGFIGGAAAAFFIREGWHVLALIHRRTSPALEQFAARGTATLLRGDAADASSFSGALAEVLKKKEMRLDVVVQAAGRASDVGWPSAFRRSHVDSARELARLARENGSERMVLVSTTDVYGLRDFHGEGEDELPLKAYPANAYPINKIAAETVLRRELPPERWSMVRPAFVWGTGDRTLMPRVVEFLKHSPWIVHFGPWRGRNRWPLAHVRNVAAAIFLAATLPRAAGRAVNVLDGEHTSVDEYYRILIDTFMPEKTFRTVCLPFWTGCLAGSVSSMVSNVLNLDHPWFDPSYYAAHAVSRNLDFGDRRMKEWFAAGGVGLVTRDEGIRELRQG